MMQNFYRILILEKFINHNWLKRDTYIDMMWIFFFCLILVDSFFNYCASIDADDVLESESSFDVYTNIDSFNQIILKLEEKYKLANFTTMEWKPLNTIDVDGEELIILSESDIKAVIDA